MPNFTCVNKPWRIFLSLSLSKLECGLQINSRKIRLYLTFSANWNKLDRVSKKREFNFKVVFSLPSPSPSPSPSSMLKLPILIGGVSVSIALPYTAISRKVVGKNVHATIPKGNMGYDQYTVPDDCSCRTYFCCFPLALENALPWPLVTILSKFFEEQRTQNHPQCLSGLSSALFLTTFLEIAVCGLHVPIN